MRLRPRAVATAFAALAVVGAVGVHAQPSSSPAAPGFVFATAAEARLVLGARDDYVRATTPLERSAKLKTPDVVGDERFVQHMQNAALEWNEGARQSLMPIIERLTRFLAGMKWQAPRQILLIRSDATLEDDLPHTRAHAIVLPKRFDDRGNRIMEYVLSHETFHVLTRNNTELREKLYSAIGFKRCDTVTIPPAVAQLRITNPDAVENRHTIPVRYRGEPVEALPYIRFVSDRIDPRAGFVKQADVAWLLIDRHGGECRARGGAQQGGVPPEELEGLVDQIGRNTEYLIHPEEILADNFSHLFQLSAHGAAPALPSPEIPEKIRRVLFE